MKIKNLIAELLGLALVLSPVLVGAVSNLTASCVGLPSTSSITWTASSSGGIAPVTFLWGNGSTLAIQTISVIPGVYSMTLGATDASSTVATTTCVATVTQPTPTTSDIQAKIQNLLSQIAGLQAQVALLVQQLHTINNNSGNTATSTPPGVCFSFDRNLSQGSNGNDVKELQRHLAKNPSIFPEGMVTGFFGHKTEEAVKRYQIKFGIASTTTGFFGPMSRNFFSEHCNEIEDDNNGNDNNNGNTNNQSMMQINNNLNTQGTNQNSGNHEGNKGNKGNSRDN